MALPSDEWAAQLNVLFAGLLARLSQHLINDKLAQAEALLM
jgi:hypothetical protein